MAKYIQIQERNAMIDEQIRNLLVEKTRSHQYFFLLKMIENNIISSFDNFAGFWISPEREGFTLNVIVKTNLDSNYYDGESDMIGKFLKEKTKKQIESNLTDELYKKVLKKIGVQVSTARISAYTYKCCHYDPYKNCGNEDMSSEELQRHKYGNIPKNTILNTVEQGRWITSFHISTRYMWFPDPLKVGGSLNFEEWLDLNSDIANI